MRHRVPVERPEHHEVQDRNPIPRIGIPYDTIRGASCGAVPSGRPALSARSDTPEGKAAWDEVVTGALGDPDRFVDEAA